VYFSADDGTTGRELWKSTGTSANTLLVKDIRAGVTSSFPTEFTDIKGNVFFAANDGINGTEIWKSNGGASTFMVKDIRVGITGSSPTQLLNLNGQLVFTADDGINGIELFRSNGQVPGTVRVKDIRAGALGSAPTNLHNHNSTLFFSADDGINGRELWKSTSFGPGTLLAANINPGAGSSNPAFLVSSATTLFFAANDGTNGTERWTLANPSSGGAGAALSVASLAIPTTFQWQTLTRIDQAGEGGILNSVAQGQRSPRFEQVNHLGLGLFQSTPKTTELRFAINNQRAAGRIRVAAPDSTSSSGQLSIDDQLLQHTDGPLDFYYLASIEERLKSVSAPSNQPGKETIRATKNPCGATAW
jgi:ELWxxDGT repeat protein